MKVGEIGTYFAALTSYVALLGMAFNFGFASPTQRELIEEGILSKSTLSIFASNVGLFSRYCSHVLWYTIQSQ